jgi:flagellar motor switch protein FliM
MQNPLSQADIDALMQALLPASGDDLFQTRGGSVKEYDFRRPTKFKKDALRTLVMIHENFVRLLQGHFAANLRLQTQLHVRGINQYSYAEYLQLLPSPSALALFHMTPLPGTCLLEISQNIAFAIVDRVFGGSGETPQPQRSLSEIELGVVQRVVTEMFRPLQEAWRNVAEVEPTPERMETNPVFLQATASSEVVAAVTMTVQMGEHLGHFCLVFPHATVDPVLARLTTSSLLDSRRGGEPGNAKAMEQSLAEAPVTVEVMLGRTRATVGEVAALRVGDVIPLAGKATDDVEVFVGGRLTYRGRPGVIKNRLGVEVRGRVEDVEP